LTFFDCSDFDVDEVISFLNLFLKAIKDNELNIGLRCGLCHNEGAGQVYYCDGNVNRLCPDCLKAKEQQRLDKEKKSCELKTSSILLTCGGALGFAFIWAILWLLYDYMFVLLGTDSISVPDIGLGIALLVIISVLSITIGLPLSRLKIRNKLVLMATVSLLTLISSALGETLNIMVWLFINYRVINIVGSIRIMINQWQNEPDIFNVIKILLVVISVCIIYFIAKRKKIVVEI
jgi:hypothetical protein